MPGPVFAQQVASYQLTEDRAALALAWNAPANSVGADTVQRVGSQGSMREGSVKNLQKRKLKCLLAVLQYWQLFTIVNCKSSSESISTILAVYFSQSPCSFPSDHLPGILQRLPRSRFATSSVPADWNDPDAIF